MPAAGKSTVGVLLAKRTGRSFVDTDLLIQAATGRHLQDIIDTDGAVAFRTVEEGVVSRLDCEGTVIATGGSVVYSEAAMRHLRNLGTVVFLRAQLPLVSERLGDPNSRGLVRKRGQSIEELFRERQPLYERYAEVTVDCDDLTPAKVVEKVVSALERYRDTAK